jgi:hypothetical protein
MMIFNSNCSTLTTPIFSTWSTRSLLLKANSRKWRRMAKGRCHSLDSPLGAMLDLTSHSLTSFSSHRKFRCKCSAPISDATTTIRDVEAKCSVVANTTTDEPAKCVAAATMTEPATSISPSSATYTECTKPRRSRFGPLF